MNEEFLSGEMQEVAAPAAEETQETLEPEAPAALAVPAGEESAENREAAVPEKPEAPDTPEKKEKAKTDADAAFAAMRRELAARQAEKARLESQVRRLAESYKHFGIAGGDPDEVADRAESHYTGRTPEEIRRDREAGQRKATEESRMADELKFYREQEVKRAMEDDLKAIQKLDPAVKTLEDLGDEYFKLIRAGVSGVTAYQAVAAKQKAEQKKAPPVIGKVNAKTAADKDFYTPDEVDKLSSAELDDPKIMERVLKSMTKWK